jgi:ATP-dependent exoDNAse (exonuclease V) alpha subunit
VLFDEAGSAPTRPAAELFARVERAGGKVIAVGDSGQLASGAAGGWFAAVAERLGGPQLREVMRQRNPAERDALEALHDGNPDTYLAVKREQGALHLHEHQRDALTAILDDWNAPRREHGLSQAVMIASDNATRALLNDRARELLGQEGAIAAEEITIAHQDFRVGDRVIARRNDRSRDIDNGTLGQVASVDSRTGELTVITNGGARRALDASYVAEHLEHAYA